MEEEGVLMEELSKLPATSERLVLTNVAWKSWLPRMLIGLALIFGALIVLGLRPVFWNIALVMAVLGIFFIFKTKAETYIFDRERQQFIWMRRTLLELKTRVVWLSEIQSVQLIELSDGQGGLDNNLYISLTDGSRLKIFSGQLIVLKDRSRIRAKQQIDAFLAESVPQSEQLDAVPEATTLSPYGKSGMQRRVTALLGRSNSRGRNSFRGLESVSTTPSTSLLPETDDAGKGKGEANESENDMV